MLGTRIILSPLYIPYISYVLHKRFKTFIIQTRSPRNRNARLMVAVAAPSAEASSGKGRCWPSSRLTHPEFSRNCRTCIQGIQELRRSPPLNYPYPYTHIPIHPYTNTHAHAHTHTQSGRHRWLRGDLTTITKRAPVC